MRGVVQRVDSARVTVDDREVGRVERGLLVYLGIGQEDTKKDAEYLANKIAGLRIFPDEKGAMNISALDNKLGALVISQFTLFGDVRRGKRPSFIAAMDPLEAEAMFDYFIECLESQGIPCQTGEFGAMMNIESVNNGPVTILLDSKKLF